MVKPEIMSLKQVCTCRKCSLYLLFMLIFQLGYSQSATTGLDNWLNDNLRDLGGRAVLLIYKDGNIVYNRAENDMTRFQKTTGKLLAKKFGRSPQEAIQDFNSTIRERIASSSKWLSAALVMTFVDEGKLFLEDTIGKYLPVMSANGKGSIKVWHCLSHLTGIQSGSLKESLKTMRSVKSMDEAMDIIAKQPMEGEPGKTFHYSNTGLQIAGAILEKISGRTFEELFEERIAKPCGMSNTDFGKGPVALPAGGAWSTGEDYIRFLTMILNEGSIYGKQVLTKESVTEMQKDRVTKDTKIAYSPAEAGTWGYGFGEWVISDENGADRSNAVTSPGLFGSFPWIDNQKKYAGFLLTFNLKNKGRHEHYIQLKHLADEYLKSLPK